MPKTKSLKSRKIDIFPKGLTHAFGRKMANFLNFFFLGNRPGKICFTIFLNEKTPFYGIKKQNLKVEKLPFFQNG